MLNTYDGMGTAAAVTVKMTTEELAELIFIRSDREIVFTMRLDDDSNDSDDSDNNNIVKWYGIMCTKIFDVQSVLITPITPITPIISLQMSGNIKQKTQSRQNRVYFNDFIMMFMLPDYIDYACIDCDEDADSVKEQSDECMRQTIEKLNQFNELYGGGDYAWHIIEY